MKQGDYYTPTIGPYDMWAIEYGYKPIDANSSQEELPELKKIASRSGEPGLAYSTDEDTRGIDPDPLVQPLRPGQRHRGVRQAARESGQRSVAEAGR